MANKSARKKPGAKARGAQAGNATARTHGFYSGRFTTEELELVAAFATDPSLDDEIWMQRVLNHRLLAFAGQADPDGNPIPLDSLIKVAEALAAGTGRVARLLRDRRVLTGESTDTIEDAIARALDEVGELFGAKL